MEHRVGRPWAGYIDAARPQLRDGGGDDGGLFIAECALLAGMRIESGDREAWLRDAEFMP